MQSVFRQTRIFFSPEPNAEIFGKKIGLIGNLFGCWHEELSRPFGKGRASYRACLNCGARKHFDPNTFVTSGSFYFPPGT
jgi:hypothetical protein